MTSRKSNRIDTLAAALAERRVLRLRDAARLVSASEMTVRRDIAANPAQFVFFGGHVMLAAGSDGEKPYDLSTAADSHAPAKREACRYAATHVRSGETIFVDCGTTLTQLVDFIPSDCHVTAICYALNIANKLAAKPNVTLILLGGLYHPASMSFAGHEGLDGIAINVAFLSAAGVDTRRGVTCEHFHEAQVKRRVIESARENFLVVDCSKIGRLRRANFAPVSAFKAVITEYGETASGHL